MKSLILSRLWMLIGIIILTTGQAWALTTGATTTQRVFTSIEQIRDVAQSNNQNIKMWSYSLMQQILLS